MKIVVLAACLFALFTSGGEAGQLTLESLFDMVAESHPLIQRENLNDDIEREKQKRFL